MKKIILAALGIIVVVGAIAVAAPGAIDWEKHKPKIQSAIHDSTGYDVSFGGPIRLTVLPFPHVSLESLAVRRPGANGADPVDVIMLKKAEVSIALAPLVRGEIVVSSINLVEPVIHLDVWADGRKSWMTEKLEQKSSAPAQDKTEGQSGNADSDSRFALKNLSIQNGHLIYTDAVRKSKQDIEKVNLVFSADSLSGPFRSKGDVVWNGKKISSDIQTGRIDKAAGTISIQADIRLPSAGATVTFLGLSGTSGKFDIQGETQINVVSLSDAMSNISGKPSAMPPAALNVQGLLTAKDDKADIKTMKLVFGDLQATGSLSISNIGSKENPIQITTDLESPSTFKVENIMPVKSVKTVKAAANSDAPKVGGVKSFLPETIAIPVPVDIQAKISMAGMSYKGTQFADVKIALDKKGSQVTFTETVAQMPGGGKFNVKAGLSFGSGSKSAGKGGYIYADPSLSYEMSGTSNAPGKFLSAFLPEATLKSMQPLFKDSIALDAKGNVTGDSIALDSGFVSFGKTNLKLGQSSYTVDTSGRDDVVLRMSGQDINIDHFNGKPKEVNPQDKVQTPITEKKPVSQMIQESIKKLDLPVDLTIKADLDRITMQGVIYSSVNIDGSVTGTEMKIANASMTDSEGDVMKVSGRIADVKNLSGVDVVLGGRTSDAVAFLSSLKVDTKAMPKDFGPLDLSVTLAGDKPDSMTFGAKAKALDGEAQANGVLLNALGAKPGIDKLTVRVTHANFESLMKKFNPSYRAGVGIRKDMDVYANINMTDSGYHLSGLKAMIGNMDLTGDIRSVTTGEKPEVTANLVAGTIPLDILSGKNKTAKSDASSPKKTSTSANEDDVRWSRNAINTTWMQSFNLDMKVQAKSIEYGNWVLNDTNLAVTLKDGVLDVAKMNASVYGGAMDLKANVRSSGKEREPLSLSVDSSFKNVALEPLAASFSGARVVRAKGNVSLDFNVQSSGISPAALVSGLAGKGDLNGKNIVIQGFDLAAMSRSLVSTTKVFDNISGLADASLSGGETAFDAIEGPFTIAEGIVHFDSLLMTGKTANILSKGQISLPRWYIDMNSTIDLVQPEDAPNLDVRFRGPLDNPGNTFAGQAMESYFKTRVNQKLQKVLGDKNPELNKLLGTVLGGSGSSVPAQAQKPSGDEAQADPANSAAPAPEQQIAPASGDPVPGQPVQGTAPAPERKMKPEEEIMNDLLKGLMGQ